MASERPGTTSSAEAQSSAKQRASMGHAIYRVCRLDEDGQATYTSSGRLGTIPQHPESTAAITTTTGATELQISTNIFVYMSGATAINQHESHSKEAQSF